MTAAQVGRLRRELIAAGALTRLPVCPNCGQECLANDFTTAGICRRCAAKEEA